MKASSRNLHQSSIISIKSPIYYSNGQPNLATTTTAAAATPLSTPNLTPNQHNTPIPLLPCPPQQHALPTTSLPIPCPRPPKPAPLQKQLSFHRHHHHLLHRQTFILQSRLASVEAEGRSLAARNTLLIKRYMELDQRHQDTLSTLLQEREDNCSRGSEKDRALGRLAMRLERAEGERDFFARRMGLSVEQARTVLVREAVTSIPPVGWERAILARIAREENEDSKDGSSDEKQRGEDAGEKSRSDKERFRVFLENGGLGDKSTVRWIWERAGVVRTERTG